MVAAICDLASAMMSEVTALLNEYENPSSSSSSSQSDCQLFTMMHSDGMHAIFSFLNYRDVLSFGETSLVALVAIQGELKTRQMRMTQSFSYPSYGGCDNSCRDHKVQLWDSSVSSSDGCHEWTVLPTVRDRVEALCRALPTSHPQSHVVLDLLIDIDENVALQHEIPIHSSSSSSSRTIHAEQVLSLHRKHCRSHKLHAMILSQVIRSNPNSIEHVYYGGGGAARSCVASSTTPRFLTVTLDRYIGDVLCAAMLMGHGVSGIVEGGPREEDWEHTLQSELGMDQVNVDLLATALVTSDDDTDDVSSLSPMSLLPMNVPVDSWYRAWIYIHSALIRTAPFSKSQLLNLGLASSLDINRSADIGNSASSATSMPAASTFLHRPHRPYMGGDKSVLMQKMSLLSNWEPLRVTFNEFGRLGPTFRGRDLIQSHTIFPAGLISSVKHFSQRASTNSYSTDDAATNIMALHLRRWMSGDDAVIQWLLEVHGSVGKARPMTVMPPMACFRSGEL